MKSIKLVCAGFGGQGVLSVGQMIAMMAMKKGLNVSWMPSYGPEMRGGTANCHVVIEEGEVGSPIIAEGITHLLAMNQPALDKFLPKCAPEAWVFINRSMVKLPDVSDRRHWIAVDFNALAQEAGNPKVQNMAALGAVCAHLEVFNEQDGLQAIEEKFKEKSPDLYAFNQAAFQKGYRISKD